MKQISLRLTDSLLEEVDQCRGLIPREVYIRSVLAAEVAMRSLENRPTQRSVIDTTLEPGQMSLAPSRRTRSAPPATPEACWHAWTKVDGKSVCKHCGQTYTKEKV